MIEIGKMNKLQIIKKTVAGAYLNLGSKNAREAEDILLPKNQLPQKFDEGDEIEVFVYIDSENKPAATIKKPKLTIGELALLRVVETTNFGAFLDWGLDKDLLLPFKEQKGRVKKGDLCLVGLHINNITNKLCATMYIYNLLDSNLSYKKNDMAQGTVYSINKDLGIFVAVDNRYHGLVLNKELYGDYALGATVEVRIKKVREDGKLELSLRKPAHGEIESDAQKIIQQLKLNDGKLLINDSSSPEQIKAELNMSKSAFKRAIGRLLKEGVITISKDGIKMSW